MTDSTTTTHDPIRARYFKPLEAAEWWSDKLFYLGACLSFLALLVDQSAVPRLSAAIQIAFAVSVLAVFVLGVGIRLYWTPRAEDQRRLDLISNAFNIPLTHEQTTGYYNNDETDPVRRLGVAVMENSHFSTGVTLEMALHERLRAGVYTVGLVII